MTRYHEKFRNFHGVTLDATRHLLKGWSGLDDESKLHRMNRWLDRVSAVYGINKPSLNVSPTVWHSGVFLEHEWHIEMPRLSVVTLLHEFRHAMQSAGLREVSGYDDAEDDARGWSLSLYAIVAPASLRRLVEAGAVMYLYPDDLTPQAGG